MTTGKPSLLACSRKAFSQMRVFTTLSFSNQTAYSFLPNSHLYHFGELASLVSPILCRVCRVQNLSKLSPKSVPVSRVMRNIWRNGGR
jgi:hypothetical protein